MGDGDVFSCKPDVLRGLADKADNIGQDIAGDASFTALSSHAVSGAHGGWRFAAAVTEVQSVWEQNMIDFGEQVSDVAVRLRSTANRYDESDQRNAAGFRVD